MHRIEISEKMWGRGSLKRTKDQTEPGKMCCLGFVCIQAGIKEEEIVGVSFPATVVNRRRQLARIRGEEPPAIPELIVPFIRAYDRLGPIYHSDSELARQLAIINDDEEINIETKKLRLIDRAALDGFEFVFVE